jgi:hypothetical protein
VRRVVHGVLPRLGGLTRDAAGLRHARPAFVIAVVVAQAASLGCYAQLYRRILAALGAKLRFRLAAGVVLASFFVSHLTPFGSATGTLVNVSTLVADGIEAATTGEGIALTSLMSTVALIALFRPGSWRRLAGTPGPASTRRRRHRPAAGSRRWPGPHCPGGPSWPASASPRPTTRLSLKTAGAAKPPTPSAG